MNSYIKWFCMFVIYRWHVTRMVFNEIIWRLFARPMPLYVYKTIKYNDEHLSEDVTDDYIDGNLLLSNDIDDTERIEYRVAWKRTSKYRMVFSKQNPISPTHELFAGAFGLSSKPKIMRATLKNLEENIEENVLQRVLKFAGPKHDFFGSNNFKMEWMFENDYLHEQMELELLLTNGKSFTFSPNDIVEFQ